MVKTIRCILIISFLLSCSAILVKNAKAENPELRKLYDELMSFKDDPEFHKVGFDECCKYNKWRLEVEALRDRHKSITFAEKNAIVDLMMLGLEYENTKGEENEYTRKTKKLIIKGFE